MAQASLVPGVSLLTLIGGGISWGLSLPHCYLMTVLFLVLLVSYRY